jgi:hypothetical protein
MKTINGKVCVNATEFMALNNLTIKNQFNRFYHDKNGNFIFDRAAFDKTNLVFTGNLKRLNRMSNKKFFAALINGYVLIKI